MKSAFGSKRKARKINTEDEDEAHIASAPPSEPIVTKPLVGRKPFRNSLLRQSIVINDDSETVDTKPEQPLDGEPPLPDEAVPPTHPQEVPYIGEPALRVEPVKKKKSRPKSSSRLSFGPGEIISGDAAEALEEELSYTPKKNAFSRRVLEANASRSGLPISNQDGDEERPTYNKDYLDELKSSTPSTPKNESRSPNSEETFDASELAGAMIIDHPYDNPYATSAIPTDAEVREKKERRARLAKEKDFISLDSGPDDNQYSLLPRKKTTETRLVREDEDIAEGFDEFVQDGNISLGRKAEREEKKRQRKQMAAMIQEAEGSSSDASDDSEAERRAQYEDAQTRAGMDGLHHKESKRTMDIPPRITPIPKLGDCLQKLQNTLGEMQLELKRRQYRLKELEMESDGIVTREVEVQRLIKEAGERYDAMRVDLEVSAVRTDRGVEGVVVDSVMTGT